MNGPVLSLLIASYVLGAIPFGLVITKAIAGVDIRKLGSGNIGATNVHREFGWKASIPVMFLDIAKGLVPSLAAKLLKLDWPPSLTSDDIALLAGFAAVFGHCASPFLGFKGGKGVATICGAAIGATPPVAAIGISAFVLTTLVTRYISVASIIAVLAAATAAYLLRYDGLVVAAFLAISVFIIYKHRANVGRLLNGEEPKFKFKGGKGATGRQDLPHSYEVPPDIACSEDENERSRPV